MKEKKCKEMFYEQSKTELEYISRSKQIKEP